MENTIKRTRGITKRWHRRKGEIITRFFFYLHNMYMSVIKTVHVAVVTDHTARYRKFWFFLKSLVSVQCFINLTRNMLIAEPCKADSNGEKWEEREMNRVKKTSEKRKSEIEPQCRYYL